MMRWYGGRVSVSGDAPSTSNVTDATATLSVAAAVTTTSVPGRTLLGALTEMLGGARSVTAAIVATVVATCVWPCPSLTVRLIEYEPADGYSCAGAGPLPWLPSPKSQP